MVVVRYILIIFMIILLSCGDYKDSIEKTCDFDRGRMMLILDIVNDEDINNTKTEEEYNRKLKTIINYINLFLVLEPETCYSGRYHNKR
ncbi:MAG: hypothetical protein KatS3mg129_2331 [Leptospiraceae bacterium]|nr:MAG: hypothetical protein KatS3mg129_2331 [Leptospiraceae bacterium]